LPDGIAFDNPALEPDPLALELVETILPAEAAAAMPAKPALRSVTAVAVASYLRRATSRTVLFLPSKTTIVERLQQ